MPCPISDLKRGAVCIALYPFSTSFPVERAVRDAEDQLLAQLEDFATIEDLQAAIAPNDPPSELLALFKLRRVLVLHDGRNAAIEDVAVARINSVPPTKRAKERWYRRVKNGTHPTHFLIGSDRRHGTNEEEAYVDASSVAVIPKATVLRRTGHLNAAELREVSTRLITALEIDVPTAGDPATLTDDA